MTRSKAGIRSGWCQSAFHAKCSFLLQRASERHREVRCDCPCHKDHNQGQSILPGKAIL